MSKSKGSRAERELLAMFWENNFAGYRAAGSGSTPLPSPDLLVGNGKRYLAIECKSIKTKAKYLEESQVRELIEFSRRFGAEPWIGLRFNNLGWYFMQPNKLVKSKKGSLIASLEILKQKGLNFNELINKFIFFILFIISMKKLLIIIILIFCLAINVNAITVINEFMYDPSGNDNNKEFIEIYSDEINNFENYTIEDLSGNKDILNLVKQVNSNYFLIVEDEFNYQDINASVYTIGSTIGNNLNNDKDVIILRDQENKIIDLVYYYSDWGAKNNGKSLERISFNSNSNDKESWVESKEGGSPGKENSIKEINFNSIKINEFLPDPIGNDDASMPQGEFIELYNNHDEDINLEDFYLQDEFGHKVNIDNTHTLNTIIKANDYLVVYVNGFSGFLNNDEDEVNLFYSNILVDKVSYSFSKEDFSWSKVNDNWILTNPSPGKSNEFGIIVNKSSVKILDFEDNAKFGDLIEVKLQIYKADTNKNAIDLFLEDKENKISEKVNFNIFGKYVNYTINVPLQIYPNCDLRYNNSKYELKVSGLEDNDKKEIKVNGINEKLCNIKGSKENKVRSDDVYFELINFPDEVEKNKDVITKVKLINNSTEIQNLDVWSYIFKGRTSISGGFNENLKKVKLNPNAETIIELSNKVDLHTEPGEYKLRVRIKKENRKTPDEITINIMVKEINENITNKLTNNIIYESSDIKAKNYTPYILITVLILIILFLILRKGL